MMQMIVSRCTFIGFQRACYVSQSASAELSNCRMELKAAMDYTGALIGAMRVGSRYREEEESDE